MQRLLATGLATLMAAAVMSAASTAPEARKVKQPCGLQLARCQFGCTGHFGEFRRACNSRCFDSYKSCKHDEEYHSKAKANDQNASKKGIDGKPSGTWTPNSSKKGIGTSSGTWTPSSGTKGPVTITKPSGGRR